MGILDIFGLGQYFYGAFGFLLLTFGQDQEWIKNAWPFSLGFRKKRKMDVILKTLKMNIKGVKSMPWWRD